VNKQINSQFGLQLVFAEARQDKALYFSCFKIGMNYQLPADCVQLYREILTSVIL